MTPPSSQQEDEASSGVGAAEDGEQSESAMESVPVEEQEDGTEAEQGDSSEKTPDEDKEMPTPASKDDTAEAEEPQIEFLSEHDSDNDTLKHTLQPGDHVIRWEMTVIAWPIQIHGIVLEVGKQYVELADFGLTAQADNKNGKGDDETAVTQPQQQQDDVDDDELSQSVSSGHRTPTGSGSQHGTDGKDNQRFHVHQQAPLMDHPMAQKMEDAVSSAWNKLRKDKKRPKQRITVHIITTQKDLNKWHKVNYGGKLFGLGGDGTTDLDEEDDGAPKKKATLADKFKNSLKFGKHRHNNNNANANNTATTEPGETSPVRTTATEKFPRFRAATAKLKNNPHVKNANEKTVQGLQKTGTATLQGIKNVNTAISNFWTSPKKQKAVASKEEQEGDGFSGPEYTTDDPDTDAMSESSPVVDDSKQEEENGSKASSDDTLSKRLMNPAMAKLMSEQQKAKEEQEAAEQPKQPSEKDTTASSTATTATKPKNKLPKSDPPKLVLARAYFLLKHGESVLPPYHAFHSNSECIAVFCKTGVWSTLQAAVFLHSTAIGNAKSTMAVTLGVAASVPVLAPVIGMAGLAMVGAPWLILKESKGKWEEATMKLTDLFWQQAEPEVFVECIEHWSGLVKKPNEKPIEPKTLDTEATTTATLSEQQQPAQQPLEEGKPQIVVVEEEKEKAQLESKNVNGSTEVKEGSDGKDQDGPTEEGGANNDAVAAAPKEDEPANFRLASV